MASPPAVVSDFIPQPAFLNTTKHGKRAKFSGNNSAVERLQHEQYVGDCVEYTEQHLPLGQVWQITTLNTTSTKTWKFGLAVGVTTTLPDKVPGFLATTFAGEHEWNYCRRLLFHNGSFSEFPHLPSLDDLTTNQSVGLLVTTNGQLHLYLDGQHVQEVASGLPAFKPLWGAVSVYGKCTEIKSEILSEPLSDERAQEIIDQALQSRSLKQRNVIAVLTGLTGSGKTWLLSRLFHRPPPGLYSSTGITEQSFRGLLHHIGNMSVGSWKLLSHKDILDFLAPLFCAGMTEADVVALAANLVASDTSEAAAHDPLPLPLSPTSSEATPLSTTPIHSKHHSLPKASATTQAMVKLVKEASGPKSRFILELVHMIDTGGQPEFMEVMSCLVHNANLAVVVVNLKFGLDDHPPVYFHIEGVAYKRLMSSQHTCRQIIEKLACTFQAKRYSPMKGKIFRILVVATHRDCVVAATIEALNQQLKSILLPTFKDELIVFSADQIAFVLNLKDPDDVDEETLELIREKVGENGLGEVVDVPGSFLMYEQDLLTYASTVGRDIVNMDECLQVGNRLKMNEEVVKAALIFFHHQNTFLYFRRVLPNLIFVKPQVLLDVVNAVVLFSYKISSGILHGIPANTVSSLQDSIITEKILHHEELSTCFIPGIYQPRHAIKLFCHTFTIALLSREQKQRKTGQKNFPQTTPASDIKEKEYLMMCLLPAIPDQELPQLIPSASKVLPLVVKFTDDCVPLGVFSGTVSCLLSKYDWNVSRKGDGSPECLAHNIVCLCHPKLPVEITLVDSTSFIKVYVDVHADEEFNEILSEMCSEVRQTIFSAIENVFKVMRLTEIKVSPAILCPCQNISVAHSASLLRLKTKQFLRCSITNSTVAVAERKHTVWFDEDALSQISSSGDVKVLSNERPTLSTSTPVLVSPTPLSPNPEQVFHLSAKRGLAILVTCDYEGTGIPPLSASNRDADEMRMTFEQFDYDIHQLKNGGATKHAVTTLLKQVSEYLGRYEGDVVNKDGGKKVIIFAFSGHGTSCGTSQDQIKTNDGELLCLTEEIRYPLVKYETVCEIPKLFFIDACRGTDYLQHKVIQNSTEKGFTAVETNFRIDFATIPHHKAYSGNYESTWMPVLARELRERDEPFSIVVDRVNEKVHKGKQLQQPQTSLAK